MVARPNLKAALNLLRSVLRIVKDKNQKILVQNAKSCLKPKKLLETEVVATKLNLPLERVLYCPHRVFGQNPSRHLRTPRVISRKTGEERMVDISGRMYSKWSWETDKATRARGLMGSTSLSRALEFKCPCKASVFALLFPNKFDHEDAFKDPEYRF